VEGRWTPLGCKGGTFAFITRCKNPAKNVAASGLQEGDMTVKKGRGPKKPMGLATEEGGEPDKRDPLGPVKKKS